LRFNSPPSQKWPWLFLQGIVCCSKAGFRIFRGIESQRASDRPANSSQKPVPRLPRTSTLCARKDGAGLVLFVLKTSASAVRPNKRENQPSSRVIVSRGGARLTITRERRPQSRTLHQSRNLPRRLSWTVCPTLIFCLWDTERRVHFPSAIPNSKGSPSGYEPTQPNSFGLKPFGRKRTH